MLHQREKLLDVIRGINELHNTSALCAHHVLHGILKVFIPFTLPNLKISRERRSMPALRTSHNTWPYRKYNVWPWFTYLLDMLAPPQ